jgi:hypothetical protein
VFEEALVKHKLKWLTLVCFLRFRVVSDDVAERSRDENERACEVKEPLA